MKSDQKFNGILDSAIKLFREKGYDNVSVLDICRDCGMTKPTFYKYMISKDNILISYYNHKAETVLPAVQELADKGCLLPALWMGLSGYHEACLQIGPEMLSRYYCVLLREKTIPFRFHPRMQESMEHILDQLQKSGEINKAGTPHTMYTALVNLDLGVTMSWIMEDGEFDLCGEYKRAVINVLELKHPDCLEIHEESCLKSA